MRSDGAIGDRVKYWGAWGAFWGGLWGLLGAAFFASPAPGLLSGAGPLTSWMVAAIEGAVVVGAVSAIGAALLGIRIPKPALSYIRRRQ